MLDNRILARFYFFILWNCLQVYIICLQIWPKLSANVASSRNSRLQYSGVSSSLMCRREAESKIWEQCESWVKRNGMYKATRNQHVILLHLPARSASKDIVDWRIIDWLIKYLFTLIRDQTREAVPEWFFSDPDPNFFWGIPDADSTMELIKIN